MLIKDGIVKGVCKMPEWSQQFELECKGKWQCELESMEDPDCQDDLIMLTTCRQNNIWIPILGFSNRETLAIILVCFDFLGIYFMTYMVIQLKNSNDKFLKIIDKHQISAKDFAIELKSLKCDKHTQDPIILKLKLWLHYTKLLEPFKNEVNSY